jgi:hypothetical protein
MIPKGFFTQIAMIGIAVVIAFTYIQPTIAEIGKIQDDISVYQEERGKVVGVNLQLETLVSRLEGVSTADNRRLLTYMPNSVDQVSVARDLYSIVKESSVQFVDVTSQKETGNRRGAQEVVAENQPKPHTFVLSVEGTYGQIKTLFALIEQNHYPLEVKSVTMDSLEGGILSAELTLVTYAFNNDLLDR